MVGRSRGDNPAREHVMTAVRRPPRLPQLPHPDRVRLAEAFRIGQRLGDEMWRGWSGAPFAVLLATPKHEFLVRHPQPSKDFALIGHDKALRSDVHVRDRRFPTNLMAAAPAVGGISTVVIGRPEDTEAATSTRWVLTLLHEHFHQMQDSLPGFFRATEALGLARGDRTRRWMLDFPFPYDDSEVGRRFSRVRTRPQARANLGPRIRWQSGHRPAGFGSTAGSARRRLASRCHGVHAGSHK